MKTSLQGTAQQVNRTGGFDLACSAEKAFPLFSPEGEREWAPGWDPRPVFPETITFRPNTVFRTGEGSEEAVWTIVEANWQTRKAEYVRVAPDSHTARISVQVEPSGPNRSHVVVSYAVTTLTERPSTVLDDFSEAGYAQRMRDWEQQISTCLAVRETR